MNDGRRGIEYWKIPPAYAMRIKQPPDVTITKMDLLAVRCFSIGLRLSTNWSCIKWAFGSYFLYVGLSLQQDSMDATPTYKGMYYYPTLVTYTDTLTQLCSMLILLSLVLDRVLYLAWNDSICWLEIGILVYILNYIFERHASLGLSRFFLNVCPILIITYVFSIDIIFRYIFYTINLLPLKCYS